MVMSARTREEYDGGHIENAVQLNESIGSEMPETPFDKEATLSYSLP